MSRKRVFAFGCLGLIVLIAALIGIPALARRIAYEQAKSRWAEKGGKDYTLIVTHECGAVAVHGEYKLTVRDGNVASVKRPSNPDERRPFPIYVYYPLSVEGWFDRVNDIGLDLWAPFAPPPDIQYDPTYGYVTRMEFWILDDRCLYTARDLVLEGP